MKRILIIRTDRIGDVTLSTPVVKALREAHPEAYIAFMVRPYARDIVEGNPWLDEVIIYDKHGAHKGFLATLFFAWRLRSKRFDTALILHPTNRAHIIAFAAGIPERIGWGRKLPALLTKSLRDEKYLGEKHEFEYTLDILRSVSVEVRDKSLYLPVRERDEASIIKKLSERGVAGSDTLLAVHPGASCPSKRWPYDRFASLISRLKSRYDAKIVLVSGPEDAAGLAELREALRDEVVDISGETSVGELAALLKRCRLFISNDSGPVHIAAAVGTPSVVIFGRKQPGLSPRRWGPTGKDDVTLHKDAGCEVCLAHDCEKGFECLKAVTIDEVLDAVKTVSDKILSKDLTT